MQEYRQHYVVQLCPVHWLVLFALLLLYFRELFGICLLFRLEDQLDQIELSKTSKPALSYLQCFFQQLLHCASQKLFFLRSIWVNAPHWDHCRRSLQSPHWFFSFPMALLACWLPACKHVFVLIIFCFQNITIT